MKKHFLALGAAAVTSALLLSACTPNNGGGEAASGGGGNDGEIKIMQSAAFYSSNLNSTTGNSNSANGTIKYFMDDTFSYTDSDLKVQPNKSFGTVEKVSDSPLKVKYSIADTAKWSDGTPYSAADLVLAWGARSGNFNTKDADKVADKSGAVKAQKGENVVFNAGEPSLSVIKKFPEIADENKTLTFEYAEPFADWQFNLTQMDSGLPAHIVAKKALGIDDPAKANAAVLKAFKDDDKTALAKLANTWNTGFDFTKLPDDPDLLVGTGPYKMTEFQEGQFLTLTRRDDYEGERKPAFKTVTFRFNQDPTAAVQALQNGEVDLINPTATADIRKSVEALDGVDMQNGDSPVFEHIDLAFANGGPFDPKTYGGDKAKALKVRQAFLKTIPRQKIVDDIIKPLNDKAVVRDSYLKVPGSDGYDEMVAANGLSKEYGTADPEAAKKLLAEAGVSKPKVRILYTKGNVRREQQFQIIKEGAEKAGFEIVDGADAQASEHLADSSRWDAALFGWSADNAGATLPETRHITTGQDNYTKYSDPQVDKLFGDLHRTLDTSKQGQFEAKIEKQLADDAYGLPLFQAPDLVGYKQGLTGIKPTTVAPGMLWNYFDWKMQ
ncbi:ABC transporter family substrate-binding protein [Brevibacterium sp. 91QC2O2]|uniref:ABC transporter family substrate-binding protein n=1 Tax=Brevibacterium sp. 91QC2O2 TaxID=2968458 RepID=UPI00211D05DC|nr:ABC transporter family substrate-binding protein [Brevibacterium sp. 91QC2O2]